MSHYESNIDLKDAARLLHDASDIVVTTHAKPDADAIGSVIALTTALRGQGTRAEAWLMPPVPAPLAALRGAQIARVYDTPPQLGHPDLVVVLDTGAWSQIQPMRGELEPLLSRTMIVDHHLSGDVPAAWRYVDGSAAACCELVAQILDASAGGPDPYQDAVVAEALFAGLAGDTGWFRFSNTRPQTHELAARLLRLGVDHSALFHQMQQLERPQKLALLTRALSGLEWVADQRGAVMVLKASDFAQTGARTEETENIVDVPQVVATVQVVVLITQTQAGTDGSPDGAIRLSFRSKPGPGAVDVAQLAQHFGGGGHARAAGAKTGEPLSDVVERVKSLLAKSIPPEAE